MKCWGFLEKGNRMESTGLVQSVSRFCGQPSWTNSYPGRERAEEALGGRGSVRPHFPFSHVQEATVLCTAPPQGAGQVQGYPAWCTSGRVP